MRLFKLFLSLFKKTEVKVVPEPLAEVKPSVPVEQKAEKKSFPPQFSGPSPVQGWSKDLASCHTAIQDAYPKVKAIFENSHPGMTLYVDYTYRGPQLQFELFKKGRALQGGQWVVVEPKLVVTNDDGVVKKGHHNTWPAQAADIYIVNNGNILWGYKPEEQSLYIELGQLWEKEGLVSGMTWKYQWKDPDHVQVAYEIV